MTIDCVRAPRKEAETIRRKLSDSGALATGIKVHREGDYIYFPIATTTKLPKALEKFRAKAEFEQVFAQPARGNLGDSLKALGKISPRDADSIVNSYDCVGDIAIVEVPPEISGIEKKIGEAILAQNTHIKVVARKESPMEGVFRVRKLKVIAGENRTETLYKESGCSILLDVAKVYFSVRLAHERLRIEAQVKKKEKILALFAGVGPFALVIAKKHPDCEIVGIELNPAAVEYFEKNITLNKARNVKAILGDVNKVVPAKYRGFADRIMMPLPHTAGDFLDAALVGANPRGCKVHFYGFVQTRDEETKNEIKDIYAPLVKLIKGKCAKAKLQCRITNKRVVRPYAPYMVQASIDFTVRK